MCRGNPRSRERRPEWARKEQCGLDPESFQDLSRPLTLESPYGVFLVLFPQDAPTRKPYRLRPQDASGSGGSPAPGHLQHMLPLPVSTRTGPESLLDVTARRHLLEPEPDLSRLRPSRGSPKSSQRRDPTICPASPPDPTLAWGQPVWVTQRWGHQCVREISAHSHRSRGKTVGPPAVAGAPNRRGTRGRKRSSRQLSP